MCWKHLSQETFEDYLRVAPIRSGDSVIIMNEVVLKQYIDCDLENKTGWNRG